MDKLFGALSLSRRAGKLVAGHDAVCEQALAGKAPLVLLSADASPRTAENVKATCQDVCDVCTLPYTKDELATLTRKPAAVLAIADPDLAALCRKAMPDEEETI